MRKYVDQLNRHDFINFVKNLIINSDNYKRNSDSDSYVIALDSGWGTGKSFFIELLKRDIENSDDNIRIVKYNAWENDYCENAFNPLFYDILSNKTFESEVDRCKPTFAIQTLEIVKHIFDIENLTFIFAIDIQQLSHSVECVYGQGIDATGYLCRFFDYIAKMPASDIVPYIKNTIKEIYNIPNLQTYSYKDKNTICEFREDIANFILDIYYSFDLSLRELDTIIQSYKIMLDNFLGKYKMVGAHIIYLFYLTLKYKEPEFFDKLVVNCSADLFKLLNEYPKIKELTEYNNNIWLNNSLGHLYPTKHLKDIDMYCGYDDKGESPYSVKVFIVGLSDDSMKVRFRSGERGFGTWNTDKIYITETDCVGRILFYPDLKNWENIKNYTWREYLHKQLEMYNFMKEKKENSV